jgi:endonuclease I
MSIAKTGFDVLLTDFAAYKSEVHKLRPLAASLNSDRANNIFMKHIL